MSSKGRVSKPSKTFTADQAKEIIMSEKGNGRSTKTFYSSVKSGEGSSTKKSHTGETSSSKKSTSTKSKAPPKPKPKGKKKEAVTRERKSRKN